MSTQTTPAGPKDELAQEDINLLNRLFGDDPNYALWRTQAGFNPSDVIRNLGDYLAQLGSRSPLSPLLGFQSFLAPAPPLAASDPVSDEFDDSVLDSSWIRLHSVLGTVPQRGAGFAPPGPAARESLSQRPGWYLLQPSADGNLCGIHKSIPSPTATGLYYCRFSMDSNQTVPSSIDGITLSLCQTINGDEVDTDNIVSVILTRDTADNTWTVKMSRKIAGVAATIYLQSLDSFSQPITQMAIAYASDLNTWVGMVGSDAGGWKILGTLVSGALSPDRIFISTVSTAQPNAIFGLDYVRREQGLLPVK